MRPPHEQYRPARHHAPMPEGRPQSWLVVNDVLISPFPARASGVTAAEAAAITAMKKQLAGARIGVWIAADGALKAQALERGPLEARRRAHASVRLKPDVAA